MVAAPAPARARFARRGTFTAPRTTLWTKYQGTDAERAVAFIERECIVPSGRGAGSRYRLRSWQQELIAQLLDPVDLAVILSGPRGLGKTGLLAPLGVWGLYDRIGAQVLVTGTGMRTAGITYGRSLAIIESSPRLAAQAQVYRNAADPWTELPLRASSMRPLPAEEAHIVGFAPTLILSEEIGYASAATVEVMQTSLGKTPGARLIAGGTPGVGPVDNVMWALRTRAFGEDPPTGLRFVEYAAPMTADPGDPATWRLANPGLGDLVDERAVLLDYQTLPLSRFRQMRLGQWSQHEDSWAPVELWDALEVVPGAIEPGTTITLGFDGSVSRDATALLAYEPERSRLSVLGVWEPQDGQEVPRAEVLGAIERAFGTYDVLRMYADPWHWRAELQLLATAYGVERVVLWNTGAVSRMGPATDALASAIRARTVSHDGNETLRRHALAAVARTTRDGAVLVKDVRHPQRIDALTAAVLAHEAWRNVEPEPVGDYAIW